MGNAIKTPNDGENPWASIARNTGQTRPNATSPIDSLTPNAATVAIRLPAIINYNSFSSSFLGFEFTVLVPEVTLFVSTPHDQKEHFFRYSKGNHIYTGDGKIEEVAKAHKQDIILRFHCHLDDGFAQLLLTLDSTSLDIKKRQAIVSNGKIVDLEEVFGIASKTECVVCLTDLNNAMFEPCRHMCCCHACSLDLIGQRCPVCRVPIVSSLKIDQL